MDQRRKRNEPGMSVSALKPPPRRRMAPGIAVPAAEAEATRASAKTLECICLLDHGWIKIREKGPQISRFQRLKVTPLSYHMQVHGERSLRSSARGGNVEEVKRLLRAGTNVNCRDLIWAKKRP